jgi:apocytochrome f
MIKSVIFIWRIFLSYIKEISSLLASQFLASTLNIKLPLSDKNQTQMSQARNRLGESMIPGGYMRYLREPLVRFALGGWGFFVCLGGIAANANAYPIYAQQAYENPREATGRIVCANCHLAQKAVDLEMPQSVFPNQVFEANVNIPYDKQMKQVIATGKKGPINVGAVLILPDGFKIAPPEKMSEETKNKVGKLYFQPYSEDKQNMIVVGPVPGKKYSEMTFPILSPDPSENKNVSYLKYPVYLGGNRGRGQIYPDGSKSNNNVFTASASGIVKQISSQGERGKDGYDITIGTNDGDVHDTVALGPNLIVKEGDTVKADDPLTDNPNIGGFGQAETSIVLQNPRRVLILIAFLTFVLFAQIFLVLKKKQFEKVQLFEMNF